MSIIRCTQCDGPFDTDVQVEAQYLPLPVCEDCVYEEKNKQDWQAIDQDEAWISNHF